MKTFCEYINESTTTTCMDIADQGLGNSKSDKESIWDRWKKKKNKAEAPEGFGESAQFAGMNDTHEAKQREELKRDIARMEHNLATGGIIKDMRIRLKNQIDAAKDKLKKLTDKYGHQ